MLNGGGNQWGGETTKHVLLCIPNPGPKPPGSLSPGVLLFACGHGGGWGGPFSLAGGSTPIEVLVWGLFFF